MAAADCVLVCSKSEAFGRVTIEGMKSGRVVIASNTGAGSELIEDGKNGYLFSPEDAETLAQIVEQIYHSSAIKAISQAGQEFANHHFSLERHAQEINKIINE